MKEVIESPLVSCVMPTYNRREFVPYALRYFLRQTYKNKELIIIDDGTDDIKDLVPILDNVHYYYLNRKHNLGEKLNLACQYANGEIIVNWDDDDWYADRRIKYQVEVLQRLGTELCGINRLFYYDISKRSAYQYIYPEHERIWLLGSSLCYTKNLWKKNRFAEINVGMDALFVWATPPDQASVLGDSTIAVHMIHKNNISPKKTENNWWHPYPLEGVKEIMGADWDLYINKTHKVLHDPIQPAIIPDLQIVKTHKTVKNVYACLVHEDEACIIDLVRNLHYHDPESIILLYNGGENRALISNRFPFEKYKAVIHPRPTPVKHGYLHSYAISCMQFALDNFDFDLFTIVDSDQLAIRSGYSGFMGQFLSSAVNFGMLSNRPMRVNESDTSDIELWPAIQAFKEYDLWRPLLRSFENGEDKFVHWSFWPSSVFSYHATRDLTALFKTNFTLHDILSKTKIWATEEVILPTLVKLLGYEIIANPCNYEYVKYKKSYEQKDIIAAIDKTDSFWIHPISRSYENENRKYIRQHFGNYNGEVKITGDNKMISFDPLNKRKLIEHVNNIEGWLSDEEADLLIAISLRLIRDSEAPINIVDIGSYHGKSTIIFGSILRELSINGKVYSIDPHDGKLGAADQGFQFFPPSFEKFKSNLSHAELDQIVEIIRDNASNVEWKKDVSIIFIDGLHDYTNVAKDFWHFSNWIVAGGYIAFHDYADYFPGVITFVDELLQMGTYRKTDKVATLIVLQKI